MFCLSLFKLMLMMFLRCFSGLPSLCRSVLVIRGSMVKENEREGSNRLLSFCFTRAGCEANRGQLISFVTDGAWLAGSNVGVAALVLEAAEGEDGHQAVQCLASSATVVEGRAVLLVLDWAIRQQLKRICIKTDCEVLVHGLNDPLNAPADVQAVFSDICFLCSKFDVVRIIKVPRLMVKAAHVKA